MSRTVPTPSPSSSPAPSTAAGADAPLTQEQLDALLAKIHADPRMARLLYMPHDFEHFRADLMLWRTVIIDVLRDVQQGCPDAWAWFTHPVYGADNRHLCQLAWVHPEELLTIAHEVRSGRLKVPTWRRIRNIWRQEPEKPRKKRRRQQ